MTYDNTRMRKDDIVQYIPSQVDDAVGSVSHVIKLGLMNKGVEPAVDYVIEQASEPRTQGKLTAQSITIRVNGKPVRVDSAFFTVVARSPR